MDNETLWNILANPADAKYAFTLNVDALVDEFPQSGLLRALLAANGTEENVRHAAVYFNPATLYKLINTPDELPTIKPAQIYQAEAPLDNVVKKTAPPKPVDKIYEELNIKPTPDPQFIPVEEDDDDDDAVNQDIDSAEGETEQYIAFEEEKTTHTEPVAEAETLSSQTWAEQTPDADTNKGWSAQPAEPVFHQPEEAPAYTAPAEPVIEQPVAEAPVQQQEVKPAEEYVHPTAAAPEPTPAPATAPVYFHQDIDDEIYDEIVSIEDINLEQLAAFNAIPRSVKMTDNDGQVTAEEHFIFEPLRVDEEELQRIQPVRAQTQPVSEPVSYQQHETHQEEIEDIEQDIHSHIPAIIVPANEVTSVNTNYDIARYNDEKLPYTFMWWLDKTRKEHAAANAYQPYITNPAYNNVVDNTPPEANTAQSTAEKTTRTNPLDELQQGYVANFVNASVLDDLERDAAANENSSDRKEDRIIKRFIQAEPHIKNTGDTKLDNENKAKRSSEDGDELITETLARIYTEQMLYAKAIAAYKKLMLKFPEKSLYFAGQIEQLEKKPN